MNKYYDDRNARLIWHNDKYLVPGMGLFKFSGKEFEGPLMTLAPNMIALYLSIADKSYKMAKELYDTNILPNIKNATDTKTYYIDSSASIQITLDFIEGLISAVVFSFTAVEGFVNSIIPLNFLFEYKDKGLVDCDWLQRNLCLEEKIKKVIPKAYSFKFHAKDVNNWERFITHKKYRDSLIHLKGDKLSLNENNQISSKQLDFIQNLVGDLITTDVVESAREIISYISLKIGDHPSIPIEFSNKAVTYPVLINKLLKKS